ncbi:MAG TPA: GWxTD domain-containing protein [Gemmatimonadales bacterium]|nr:GWxTD domain-containing protein [Gemmatimonadales bacterium]
MIRRAVAVAALVFVAGGCGTWQRVGSSDAPAPGTTLPRLFDATSMYRSMGFLATSGPLPFVASIRYLRGPAPDSTLALFALSLANTAITFQRSGAEFVAEYRLEVVFKADSGLVPTRHIARDESVRVRSFQETLRADESVIFQQFVTLPPGTYQVSVMVRDRNGPAFSRTEVVDTAPDLWRRPGLAAPIPVYQATVRTQTSALPTLLANPRATLPYGTDTLRFYVEGYGITERARLVARVVDGSDRELWRDTVALQGDAALAGTAIAVAPDRLPVGQAELRITPVAGGDTARARFLVSFSNQWVITNFEEMMSLLRYFDEQEWVDSLRKASAERRPVVWREFWKATDPVSITPENEALDDYFRKVQQANVRFPDEGEPGWLTDRGEVLITLGEPDEILDLSSGMDRSGLRAIRWTYSNLRVVLYFQDQTGFNHFRLTPTSRAEYQRVRARVRRSR